MPAPLVRPSWRPACIVVVVAAIGLVGAVGAAVHNRTTPTAFDDRAARPIFEHISEPTGAALLDVSSPMLSVGMLLMLAVGAALCRRWALVALTVVGPTVAFLATEVLLKPLVHRRIVAYATAYPSGHETGLVSVLVVLLVFLTRVPLSRAASTVGVAVLAGWALLGAIGLVRQHYHFPTDTIGGTGVALACVLATALAIDWIAARAARTEPAGTAQLTRRS